MIIFVIVLIIVIAIYNKSVYYCPKKSNHIDILYKIMKKHDNALYHQYRYILCYGKTNYNYLAYLGGCVLLKIPMCSLISHKKYLWTTLKGYYGEQVASQITPKTYIMPDDYSKYRKDMIGARQSEKDKTFSFCRTEMIFKTFSHKQEGLFVTKQIQSLPFIKKEKFIVAQKFINNPYYHFGKKISTRIYLILECYNNKLEAYYYPDGLVYYSKDNKIASFYDSVNIYSKKFPIVISDLEKLTGHNLMKSMVYNMGKLVKALHDMCHSTIPGNYYYEFFGVDFQITDKLDSYILEVNSGPGMDPNSKHDHQLRYKILYAYYQLFRHHNSSLLIKL